MKLHTRCKELDTCWCGLMLQDIDAWTWIQFETTLGDGPWSKMDIYECPARHIIGAVGPPQDREDDE